MKRLSLSFLTLIVVVGASVVGAGGAGRRMTDDEVRDMMISRSIATYSGSCPCPYNADRAGRSCGRRSAYSRAGGATPLCYRNDISARMVESYRSANNLAR